MSRITKQIAENVAAQLTRKKNTEISSLKKELENKFSEIYLKTVPKEVLQLFEKFPDYVKTRRGLQCTGNGFEWQTLDFNKELPAYKNCFSPDELDAKELLELANKIKDKKQELFKLKAEIENVVFNLRTFKRVEIEFPEAVPFLPTTVSTALMVNISDLRNKLK